MYIIEHLNIPIYIQFHCVQKSCIYLDLLSTYLHVNLKLPPSFHAKKSLAPWNGIVNPLQASQQSRFMYKFWITICMWFGTLNLTRCILRWKLLVLTQGLWSFDVRVSWRDLAQAWACLASLWSCHVLFWPCIPTRKFPGSWNGLWRVTTKLQ